MNFLLAITTFVCLASTVQGTPWVPEARTDDYAVERHVLFKRITAEKGKKIKAIFYGNSIIEAWNTCEANGLLIWEKYYEYLGSRNYGIGADRTEHLLYRIEDGEVDGLYPKVAVVMIGTNNRNDTPAEVAKGIEAVVNLLLGKLPKVKVLLLGVLPRHWTDPSDTGTAEYWYARVSAINILISKLEDKKRIWFLDMFDQFSTAWGQIDQDLYDPDRLHLSVAGYQKWADTMNHLFFELYFDTYDDDDKKYDDEKYDDKKDDY